MPSIFALCGCGPRFKLNQPRSSRVEPEPKAQLDAGDIQESPMEMSPIHSPVEPKEQKPLDGYDYSGMIVVDSDEDDSPPPPTFPTPTHLHYAIARALGRPTPKRQAFPPSVLATIFRYAGFYRTLAPASKWSWTFTTEGAESAGDEGNRKSFEVVTSKDIVVQRKLILATPVLDEKAFVRLAALQVTTLSTDQGWCKNPDGGSWTWFDIGFLGPDLPRLPNFKSAAPTDPSVSSTLSSTDPSVPISGLSYHNLTPKLSGYGIAILFESHRNKLNNPEFLTQVGRRCEPEEGWWDTGRPADRIGVWMAAQFSQWECRVKDAALEAFEWYGEEFFQAASRTEVKL